MIFITNNDAEIYLEICNIIYGSGVFLKAPHLHGEHLVLMEEKII